MANEDKNTNNEITTSNMEAKMKEINDLKSGELDNLHARILK